MHYCEATLSILEMSLESKINSKMIDSLILLYIYVNELSMIGHELEICTNMWKKFFIR